MPGKIFINYRRDDSAPHALNIAQYMEKAFGTGNVFIDVDHIKLGENFETVLEGKLKECAVLLAIMGPNWANARDAQGNKRLDDANDWVRMEIVRAVKRGIKVIPVLVGGATTPPSVTSVPDDLAPVLKHQAAVITTNGFRYEMAGLATDVRTIVGRDHRRPLIAASLGVVFLGVLLGAIWLSAKWSSANIDAKLLQGSSFEAQLSEKCRKELGTWRNALAIGVFAMAANGECGSFVNGTNLQATKTAALEACGKVGADCRVVELNEGNWAPKPACGALYGEWKSDAPAKVFAVARSGNCASSTSRKQLEDARTEALATCEREFGNCRIHDVDQGNWEPVANCKTELETYRKAEPSRAFAIARNGACGWADDHMNQTTAEQGAMQECATVGTECRILEQFSGNWEPDKECKVLIAKWSKLSPRGSFAAGQSGGCGYSYNYSSVNGADNEALGQCRTNNGNECKVIMRR